MIFLKKKDAINILPNELQTNKTVSSFFGVSNHKYYKLFILPKHTTFDCNTYLHSFPLCFGMLFYQALVEPSFTLINSLVKAIQINDADRISSSLLTLFNGINSPLPLLKNVITQEVKYTSEY